MIECMRFKECKKNCLIGFADLKIPAMCLEIYGCALYEKDGRRWVSMPSREYTDRETQEKKFLSVVRFSDREKQNSFSDHAVKAISEYAKKEDISLEPTEADMFAQSPF